MTQGTIKPTGRLDFRNDDLGIRYSELISKLRKDNIEINRLISKSSLTPDEMVRLKKLFLQDAHDRINDRISVNDWQEIIEARVVVCASSEKLIVLANMLHLI